MIKKDALNGTQNYTKNINILNISGHSENSFNWFRSNNYEIIEGDYGMNYDSANYDNDILSWYLEKGLPYPSQEKWEYIKSKSKVLKFGKVNLKSASIALMNIDSWDEEEIIKFYREYGPLGLMPYFSSKSSSSNPILHLMYEGNAKPIFNENLSYTNYWPTAFNLNEQYVFDPGIEPSDEIVNKFNSFDNKLVYTNYSEPLWLAQYVISEFQLYLRTLIKDVNVFESFYRARVGVSSAGYDYREYFKEISFLKEDIKDNIKILTKIDDFLELQFYIPANSLFQAIFIFTILNYKNIALGKCKNPTCLNLFWKEHNRRQYCSDGCKSTVGGRNQRAVLTKNVSAYILKKYRNSIISTDDIFDMEKYKVIEEFGKSVLDVFNKSKIDEWLDRK